MIELAKQNIPSNKTYPYFIEGAWDQRIDCSKEDLVSLYKQIKKELHIVNE